MNLGQMKAMKEKNKKLSSRSEEIADIIDRMPITFGRWVAIAVIAFTTLLLLFGWIIKYPDIVTGQIKINAQNATIRLVANTSGNLHLLCGKAQDNIKRGDYIAVIQNSASTEDIRKVLSIIDGKDLTEKQLLLLVDSFPNEVSLGEVSLKYYTFLAALKSKADHLKRNVYQKQKDNLLADIEWRNRIIEDAKKILDATQNRLQVSQKWLERYKSLNKKEIATYEFEVDQMNNNYLALIQEVQNCKKEISATRMQIADNYHALERLDIEQKEKERELLVDILSSFQDLKANLTIWEQKYAFKAPFTGKVEFLKFLAEGQFLQSGEEVFGIIPIENHIFGQVLLPANGAGKVKEQTKVSVKLDNYPYMEYGYIDGVVSSISLVSQPLKTENNTVETYLINVELPDGLTTNYGEHLDFKYEIGGTADFIVKERRLIERLFDNLKKRIK